MTYPIFAFLPGWIFSTPGLLFIIMTLESGPINLLVRRLAV